MNNQTEPFTLGEEEKKVEVTAPRMYRVLLINDDKTTFDFVIYVLMRFFHKSELEASKVTLEVHNQGQGVAGIYSKDEAESRIQLVTNCAREHNFPLNCKIEEE